MAYGAICLAALIASLFVLGKAQSTSGTGQTTRYWDCCKPSCAWPGKADTINSKAVNSCAKDGVTVLDPNIVNACGGGGASGGPAYMCASQQPWAINNTLAMGFVAYDDRVCCGCYEVVFTSGPVSGQTMVVQTTNSGSDLGNNHFDVQIPGGGVGIYNGCQSQYNAPADGWGQRYGGISSQSQCTQLPASLQPGCNWRFTWFKNADNPTMRFQRVKCPKSIIAKSGCQRTDDTSQNAKYANL